MIPTSSKFGTTDSTSTKSVEKRMLSAMVRVVSRWPSIVLLSLFLGAVVVGPSVHRAHCCDSDVPAQTASGKAHGTADRPADKPHNQDTCPVCQMAATAFALPDQPQAVISTALPVAMTPPQADGDTCSLIWLSDAPPTGPPSSLV